MRRPPIGSMLALAAALAGAMPRAALADQVPLPLGDAIERARRAVAALDDYECHFENRQRIDGKLEPLREIRLRQSHRMGCVYMKWVGEVHRNREAIWCRDRYDGKLQAHEGSGPASWLPSLSLDPEGSIAMRGNLRPVTESGIHNTVDFFAREVERGMAEGALREDSGMTVEDVAGAPAWCARLPVSEDAEGLFNPGGVARFCLHEETFLPVEVVLADRDGATVELYRYSDCVLNPGFSETTFDVENPEYDF